MCCAGNQRGDAGSFTASIVRPPPPTTPRNGRVTAAPLPPAQGDFIDGVIEGSQPYGSWAAHLLDWSAAFEDERVLLVRFEEMKEDLPAVVRKVPPIPTPDPQPPLPSRAQSGPVGCC